MASATGVSAAASANASTYYLPFTPKDFESLAQFVNVDVKKTDFAAIKKTANGVCGSMVQHDHQGRLSFPTARYITSPNDSRTTSDVEKTEEEKKRAALAKEKADKKRKEKNPGAEAKPKKESKSKARDPNKRPLAFPVNVQDSAIYTWVGMLARLIKEKQNKATLAKYSPEEVDAVGTPLTKALVEYSRGYDEKSPLMGQYINENHFASLRSALNKILKNDENTDSFNILIAAVRRCLFEASMDAIANFKAPAKTEEEKKAAKAKTEANKKKSKEEKDAEKKAANAKKKQTGESSPKKPCMNVVNLPRGTVTLDSLLVLKYLQRSGVYAFVNLPSTSALAPKYKSPNVLVNSVVCQFLATVIKNKEEEKKKNAERKAKEKSDKEKTGSAGTTDSTHAAKASVSSSASSSSSSSSSASEAAKPAVNSQQVATSLVDTELPDL
jgi:hypothetical protein